MYIRVNSPLRVLHLTEIFLAFFIYYLGTLIFKDFRILVVSQGHKGNYCATVIYAPYWNKVLSICLPVCLSVSLYIYLSSVVMNRTVVDSKCSLENSYGSHLHSQSELYPVSWWYSTMVIDLVCQLNRDFSQKNSRPITSFSTTALFRTTLTRTIIIHLLIKWLLGSNLSPDIKLIPSIYDANFLFEICVVISYLTFCFPVLEFSKKLCFICGWQTQGYYKLFHISKDLLKLGGIPLTEHTVRPGIPYNSYITSSSLHRTWERRNIPKQCQNSWSITVIIESVELGHEVFNVQLGKVNVRYHSTIKQGIVVFSSRKLWVTNVVVNVLIL